VPEMYGTGEESMRVLKHKTLAVAAATLGVAALFGASLGIVAAGSKPPLAAGFNLAGGPLGGDVPPAEFVACLPASSWAALYVWDGERQEWRHFFPGVPAYVNAGSNSGIDVIKRFSGVVIIMNQAVSTPRLKDNASESCG